MIKIIVDKLPKRKFECSFCQKKLGNRIVERLDGNDDYEILSFTYCILRQDECVGVDKCPYLRGE